MLKYKNLFRKATLQSNFLKLNQFYKMFSSIISVDMGATNTCIAILESGGPRVIENAEGLRTTPTIITVEEDGTETLAVVSKRQAIEKMENSFYGYKFFYGRKYNDELVQKLLPKFAFKIEEAENGGITFVNSKGIKITPSVCTTKYLAYIKEQAQSLTGKDINKCVLALPRFIPEAGHTEIKESFKNADLEILEIIDESQAAIKGYELDKNDKIKNVIVFNLGGSNLSITYLSKEDEAGAAKAEFEFISEKFDFELSGNEIDKLIINVLLDEFKKVNKMDVSKELYALQRISEAAEKAKIELSLSQQVEISLPFLAADHTGPKHLNMRFSRAKFENLIDPITSKLQAVCSEFLKDTGIVKEKIDEVILLGGVCRIPKIQEILKGVFGKEPNKNVNPEEAATIGGALMTKKIVDKMNQIKYFKKMPYAFGIEILGGNFKKLLNKNTKLPAKITTKIKTVIDNQPRINLKFFIGDRQIASLNKLICELKLKIVKPEERGQEIDLEVKINRSGDISMFLNHRKTNKSVSYSGNILGGISKESISELDILTHEHKDNDMKECILNKSRVEAEKKMVILEKLIEEHKEKLIKSGKYTEKEMYEDLMQFHKIINDNIRKDLLDCEETIDENIDFVTKLVHSKI